MSENNNHNNTMKAAEFRGFVASEVKNIFRTLEELKFLYHKLDDKISDNQEKIVNNCNHQVNKLNNKILDVERSTNKKFGKISVKVAGVSATVALLITVILILIKYLLGVQI